jgi:REP element-mobilizing transposase RayT
MRPRNINFRQREKYLNSNRKNIRLKDYDYSKCGAYFITICTKDRKNIFWKDLQQLNIYEYPDIKLNKFGKIVKGIWLNTEKIYEDIILDAYSIMPNHFHGILIKENLNNKKTVGNIINIFKATVTKELRKLDPNIEVWQRNYYEHIVREKESEKIQYYVLNNPYNFIDDIYYI